MLNIITVLWTVSEAAQNVLTPELTVPTQLWFTQHLWFFRQSA